MRNICDRRPENATSVAKHDKLWKMTPIEQKKRKDIWSKLYTMDAMMIRQWMGPNQKRHTITRLAVHGFHHKIFDNNYFHQPNDTCVCSMCKLPYDRYLLIVYNCKTKSVINYSEQKKFVHNICCYV